MRFTIFGVTVSSSWGNGHATTWRGLLRALRRAGHHTTFFERDVSYYAGARDLAAPDFCHLQLYADWPAIEQQARAAVSSSDVVIVSSYCPDGVAAARLALDDPGPLHVFYDIDTPVTLADLERYGVAAVEGPHYVDAGLVREFDLYLSFTGGPLLSDIRSRWGARRAAPLYCSVDPGVHRLFARRADFDRISATSARMRSIARVRWMRCCSSRPGAGPTVASSSLARSTPKIRSGRQM